MDFAADIDAVLLTCSTLGPAVADCRSGKVWRADGMLARKVAAALQRDPQSRIALLCAAPTTYEATRDLFMQALLSGDAHLRLQLQCVEGAWALFRRGDLSGYQARMTDAAFQAYAAGAVVARAVGLPQLRRRGARRHAASTPPGPPMTGLARWSSTKNLQRCRPAVPRGCGVRRRRDRSASWHRARPSAWWWRHRLLCRWCRPSSPRPSR